MTCQTKLGKTTPVTGNLDCAASLRTCRNIETMAQLHRFDFFLCICPCSETVTSAPSRQGARGPPFRRNALPLAKLIISIHGTIGFRDRCRLYRSQSPHPRPRSRQSLNLRFVWWALKLLDMEGRAELPLCETWSAEESTLLLYMDRQI